MAVIWFVVLSLLISVPLSFTAGVLACKKGLFKSRPPRRQGKITRYESDKDLFDTLADRLVKDELYLDPDLDLNLAAKLLCTNRTYLSEAVNSITGESFPTYVNGYRINRALDEIRRHPEMNVEQWALTCGFKSGASFSAQFKLAMNMTPGRWIRKNKSKLMQLRR